jgi:hypothetical protein
MRSTVTRSTFIYVNVCNFLPVTRHLNMKMYVKDTSFVTISEYISEIIGISRIQETVMVTQGSSKILFLFHKRTKRMFLRL